jgi:hypothetical protein
LDRNPIKGGLREVALRLECVDPFFQLSIRIDDAILDCAIELVEFFVSGSELDRQRSSSILNRAVLCTLTFQQRFQDRGEALRREQTFLDVFDNAIGYFGRCLGGLIC